MFSLQVTYRWQPQATSFSVLRLPYYGLPFETIIRILQSEAVVWKQCVLFMKLPRECSYQARRINQSLLVALCTIASIWQNFLPGRGGGGGRRWGSLQKEGWQQSPGTAFSQYSSSKNVIYIWWLYIQVWTTLIMVSSKNSLCWNIGIRVKREEGLTLAWYKRAFLFWQEHSCKKQSTYCCLVRAVCRPRKSSDEMVTLEGEGWRVFRWKKRANG